MFCHHGSVQYNLIISPETIIHIFLHDTVLAVFIQNFHLFKDRVSAVDIVYALERFFLSDLIAFIRIRKNDIIPVLEIVCRNIIILFCFPVNVCSHKFNGRCSVVGIYLLVKSFLGTVSSSREKFQGHHIKFFGRQGSP